MVGEKGRGGRGGGRGGAAKRGGAGGRGGRGGKSAKGKVRGGYTPPQKKKKPAQPQGSDKKDDLKKRKRKDSEEEEEQEQVEQPERKALSEMSRLEKKKLKKMKRPHFEVLDKMKTIWEKLRDSRTEGAEKKELVDQLTEIFEGKVYEFIFKHDASRVVQAWTKNGDDKVRKIVFAELKGHFVETSKNIYGKHVVIKLLELGTKEQRSSIIKEFYTKVRAMASHAMACKVLEYAYTNIATADQKAFLVQEFYGPQFALFKDDAKLKIDDVFEKDPAQKEKVLAYMSDTLPKMVDKGMAVHTIVHRALWDYMRNASPRQNADMVACLKDALVHMMHTPEGANVVANCIAYGSVKDRKAFIKAMKGLVAKTARDEHGVLVIMTLLELVDDTVLVQKAIISELQEELLDISQNQKGRKPILQLLAPYSPKYFAQNVVDRLQKFQSEAAQGTIKDSTGEWQSGSKKSPEGRRSELIQSISPSLLKLVTANADDLLRSQFGCHVVLETLKNAVGDKESAVNAVAQLAKGDMGNNILFHNVAHRIIKMIVAHDGEAKGELGFAQKLADHVEGNLHRFYKKNEGAFVVLSLLECPPTSGAVREEIEKKRDGIRDMDNAGCRAILKVLDGEGKRAAPEPAKAQPSAKKAKKSKK